MYIKHKLVTQREQSVQLTINELLQTCLSKGKYTLKSKRKTYSVLTKLKYLSDIYSNSLTLDFSFDRSDEMPLDVFEDIFANYEKRK